MPDAVTLLSPVVKILTQKSAFKYLHRLHHTTNRHQYVMAVTTCASFVSKPREAHHRLLPACAVRVHFWKGVEILHDAILSFSISQCNHLLLHSLSSNESSRFSPLSCVWNRRRIRIWQRFQKAR